MEEKIKDLSGRILGVLETRTDGDKIAYSFPGRTILGYYRKRFDYTTDFYGKILTKGDTAIALIYKQAD